jgi:hypothetical protein
MLKSKLIGLSGAIMKSLEVKQLSQSNLSLDFSPELLKADEDEFVAFIEDTIRLLQSQLLSIQES